MTDLRVIEANLGHAKSAEGVKRVLTRHLPKHGRWVLLLCEAHRLESQDFAPDGGTVHQAEFVRKEAKSPWGDPFRGKCEVAIVTGPEVQVETAELVKVMDGPRQPTKYQHDRWAWFVWASIEGERFVFVSSHFQANIQRGGVVNPLSATAKDYARGVAALCDRIEREADKGYTPVFGADLNYRPTVQPWKGSPYTNLCAIPLVVRNHRIDAIATDPTNTTWDRDLRTATGAPGTDHLWLVADLRTHKGETVARPDYKAANAEAQWFANAYPGSAIDPNVLVLHTTEGTDWPSYSGGASAPHYTAKPSGKRLAWRQHFPESMSSRALRNEDGGVETNTLNCVQVELVGTCAPATRNAWVKAGKKEATEDDPGHFVFWPEAPDWALKGLADFVADIHKRQGIKLQSRKFLAYPDSYGASPVRMTGPQWVRFYGICGHQHVPENSHGDPGDLNIEKVLRYATALAYPEPEQPNNHVTAGRDLVERGLKEFAQVNPDRAAVKKMADAIAVALKEGPTS